MVTTRFQRYLLSHSFNLLYHGMAWTYDFVAEIASAGKWDQWINTSLPYIHGPKVLELGFGPGHLQVKLLTQQIQVFGIDESRQMGLIASRRIQKRNGGDRPINSFQRLVRGKGQHLPFPSASFNSVVSTFPSPYIFDPATVEEVLRVLSPGGNLIVVLGAEITGKHAKERIAAWLMRITHQSSHGKEDFQLPSLGGEKLFDLFEIALASSRVVLMKAMKPDKKCP